MDAHLNNKTVPSLCFNREDFMTKEFSVDKFVSEYRKYASLDTIREDLNVLHKKLCTAMVELINEDYADFVNLSSNLVGLDKSIKNLTLPLQNLRNEVEQIKNKHSQTLDIACNMFDERTSSHASKVLIHHVLSVFEGLEKIKELRQHNSNNNTLETLERIAFTFNIVKFHMSKIAESDIKDFANSEMCFSCNEAVKEISKSIESQLESVFLQSLRNSNMANLEKVLRIYAIISSENKVEYCFQCKVVRPYMKNVITQSSIMKDGLVKVYNDILSFIPKCGDILKITSSSETESHTYIPGYDFIVNAVWPEIISCFQYVSQVYLYSIGDPVLFHENYTATMNFLDQFEHQCQQQSSVKRLREHPSYKDFIKKWNLNVYFEIRFQEIASYLEEKLEDFFVKSDGVSPYMLSATHAVYSSLEQCWDKSIYLPPLKSGFLKLFLQLLSRYKKSADSNLMIVEDNAVLVAMLIKDVEFLVAEVKNMFHEIVCPKLNNEFEKKCFQVAFDEGIGSLEEIPHFAGKLIVKLLTEKCSSHLKLIANIPQRYRKTNREIPSKPSPYVTEVLSPLTNFLLESNFLPLQWKKYCELEVTDEIMKKCTTSMRDVLTSIKKMEDSLKILKRARDKPSGQFSSGAITDDDKIRRQLAIDVSYFEELILKSGLETSNLKTLKELKDLVTSAERVPGLSVNS